MIRILLASTAALTVAACDEMSYSVSAPSVSESARFVGVTLPDGTSRMVRTVAMTQPDTFAEMRAVLKNRCNRLTGVDHLKGVDLGKDVLVFRATCDSGAFQVTAIGNEAYVKPWTGTLRDAS